VSSPSLYATPDGNIGAYAYLRTYEIESRLPNVDEAVLNSTNQNYPAVMKPYLAVPNNPAIAQHVDTAIRNAKGPYDKAEAIRRYVGGRCTYNLQAARVPVDRDPVDYFLNDSRQGYCDLYASAVAIMCRMAGLPARIATGFNGGEPSPDNNGAFQIRESNRHAWAEVYFVGQGWVPFDATALTPALAETAQVNQSSASRSLWSRIQPILTSPWAFIVPGFLLIFVSMSRANKRNSHADVITRTPEAKALALIWKKLEGALARAGIDTNASRTISEIVADTSRILDQGGHSDASDSLRDVSASVSDVLYGGQFIPMGDVKRIATAVNAVILKVNSLSKVAHRR